MGAAAGTTLALTLILIFGVVPWLVARHLRQLGQPASAWVIFSLFFPVVVPLVVLAAGSTEVVHASTTEAGAPALVLELDGRPASAYGLGPARAHYPLDRARAGLRRGLLAVVAGLVTLPLAAGLAAPLGAVGVALGLLAVGGLVALILLIRRDPRAQVVVADEGLLLSRRGATEAFRWEQIEAVWQDLRDQYVNGIQTVARRCYTLTLRDGGQRVLDERYLNVVELGTTLQVAVARHQLPRMEAVLDAGERVACGDVSLLPQGIAVRKAQLAWAEVGAVTVDRGYLVITRRCGGLGGAVAKSLESVAAFVTSIVGTAQPRSRRGGEVIWQKVPAARVCNLYAVIALAEARAEGAAAPSLTAAPLRLQHSSLGG